jgi:hypothetical protein
MPIRHVPASPWLVSSLACTAGASAAELCSILFLQRINNLLDTLVDLVIVKSARLMLESQTKSEAFSMWINAFALINVKER